MNLKKGDRVRHTTFGKGTVFQPIRWSKHNGPPDAYIVIMDTAPPLEFNGGRNDVCAHPEDIEEW